MSWRELVKETGALRVLACRLEGWSRLVEGCVADVDVMCWGGRLGLEYAQSLLASKSWERVGCGWCGDLLDWAL